MLALLLSALFTLVELNCENLFDTEHDSLKQDMEFTPRSDHHWTRTRYWRKLNHISKEIIAMGEDSVNGWQLPDLVALCEVENDSVMHDLTRRSLLRGAGYQYVMTGRGLALQSIHLPFAAPLWVTDKSRQRHAPHEGHSLCLWHDPQWRHPPHIRAARS